MEWSNQQEIALKRVQQWRETSDNPVFMLAGFAGSGKTTLAKYFARNSKGTVLFAAYTGKAAHVLRQSGAPNVSTIHKLIYLPKDKCKARLRELEAELDQLSVPFLKLSDEQMKRITELTDAIKQERTNLERPSWTLNNDSPLQHASLLILDEYSMVDQQMGEDLLSFGCPILALGDPGQLPPIFGNPFFMRQPDYMLTEIHRQAADNPIIRMSKDVREGKDLAPGTYGDSRVIRFRDIAQEELRSLVLSTDQLLVGKNATRTSSNRRTRELLGRKDLTPESGDKVVCLRNNHQSGLLNGQTWTVKSTPVVDDEYLVLRLGNDEGGEVTCLAHFNHFIGTADKLDFWTRRNAEEFDYGYALTVHKSQGSQWNNILLFDEWRHQDRQKWLYTAITRAAQQVTVIQMV
jgi:exodeoxyribonuclease-5